MTRQQRLVAACSALVVFAELLGMGMAMLLSSLLSNDVAGLVKRGVRDFTLLAEMAGGVELFVCCKEVNLVYICFWV
jgi:hypothetical protein